LPPFGFTAAVVGGVWPVVVVRGGTVGAVVVKVGATVLAGGVLAAVVAVVAAVVDDLGWVVVVGSGLVLGVRGRRGTEVVLVT